MLSLNARLDEQVGLVAASAIGALTTTIGDTTYVSMKGFRRLTIFLDVTNATTVTGGTITLKQATDVTNSQSDEKALAFTRMKACTDVAASQALVETAVVSNTFVTSTTNSKRLRYVIEVDSDQLDVANGFDCVRLDSTGMAAAEGSVTYILWGARYNSGVDPTAN